MGRGEGEMHGGRTEGGREGGREETRSSKNRNHFLEVSEWRACPPLKRMSVSIVRCCCSTASPGSMQWVTTRAAECLSLTTVPPPPPFHSKTQLNRHATRPNTSRRFAPGARDVCLVGESPTWSVSTYVVWGRRSMVVRFTAMHHTKITPAPAPQPLFLTFNICMERSSSSWLVTRPSRLFCLRSNTASVASPLLSQKVGWKKTRENKKKKKNTSRGQR